MPFIAIALLYLFSFASSVLPIIPDHQYAAGKPFNNPQGKPVKPVLKSFHLSAVRLLDQQLLSQARLLNKEGMAAHKIEEIDAFMDDAFRYHLLDTVLSEKSRQLILIGREYENENIVWLCHFQNGKLAYAKEVYYDNAEGNYLLESKLEKQILVLMSDDINEGRKTERFRFNEKLEWVKAPALKK